jgi:hypothetical protein
MNPAPENQGPTYYPIRTGARLGLVFGFVFAIADPLLSILQEFDWYRVEGVGRAIMTELYSIAVYVPPVFALGLILSIPFWLAGRIKSQSTIRDRQDEILSGIFTGLLAFIILLSLGPPESLWGMFLESLAFAGAGILAGAGAGALTGWLKRRFLSAGSPITMSC